MLEKAEEFGCQREKSSLPKGDVDLEILNLDVRVGDNFNVTLQFNNRSDQRRSADVYIIGTVVYYTGVPSGEVVFNTPRVKLEPLQSEYTYERGGMGTRVSRFNIDSQVCRSSRFDIDSCEYLSVTVCQGKKKLN